MENPGWVSCVEVSNSLIVLLKKLVLEVRGGGRRAAVRDAPKQFDPCLSTSLPTQHQHSLYWGREDVEVQQDTDNLAILDETTALEVG